MKEVECICITYIRIGKQKIKTFQYEREKQKKGIFVDQIIYDTK